MLVQRRLISELNANNDENDIVKTGGDENFVKLCCGLGYREF